MVWQKLHTWPNIQKRRKSHFWAKLPSPLFCVVSEKKSFTMNAILSSLLNIKSFSTSVILEKAELLSENGVLQSFKEIYYQ